ncbi:MAG: hypothetical protein ABSG89_13735, partial [Bacteroidales bacterium]
MTFVAALVIIQPLYAQTTQVVKFRVSGQLLNPREYPDDTRRHVKPPDWNLMSDRTHFTTLRQFRVINGQLTGFDEDIERYTRTFDLGDFIWPNHSFLAAKNIFDLVDEIKKRDLFLYQIWGYVPGSGSGGQWQQVGLTPEISSLFETKLGDHWLGMDMGEQDGRYVIAYTNQMYPSSADRRQQYLNFHRHMEKITDECGNKMAALTAITYAHYFLKEGLYTFVGSETGQEHPNAQVFYAFDRGAGKQDGVPWFGNASIYNRWGGKSYGGMRSHPTKGTSLSLLKRLLYSHILYNSMAVGFENEWFDGDSLSPIGRIQQSAQKWVRETGQPGVMQTPIGLLLDFYMGWIFPNYDNILYRIWGNLPYGAGDYLTNDILDMFYPGYQNSSFFHNETGFLTATPYGDMCDILLSDAPGWLLERYPLLVVAGELSGGAEVRDKLKAYVEQGGKLFITAGSLRNLPGGLAGIGSEGHARLFSGEQKVLIGTDSIIEGQNFELLPVQIPASARIVASVKCIPAVIQMPLGKGMITVFASPFGIGAETSIKEPIVGIVDKPLVNPYPILRHVRDILDKAFQSQKLFDAGDGLSLIVCRRGTGDYTLGISNNLLNELPLRIVSNVGPIQKIDELPLDQSEKKAIGYLPEGFEKANIGVSGNNIIAGSDIRIFRVRVKEEGVEEIAHITPPPNPQNRFLPLHGTNRIQDEILTRPTFFQHFDGVAVDWKYLVEREKSTLKQEAGWLGLQKVRILVDLTSGINLFPDLRIVNNIESEYNLSMERILDVVEKMDLLGAHDLLIPLQRFVENNISKDETWKDFDSTLRLICRKAELHHITVYLRLAPDRPPHDLNEAMQFINRIDAPNLQLAPSTALLLDAKCDPKEITNEIKGHIGIWIVNTPAYDLEGKRWNAYGPIAGSNCEKELEALLSLNPAVPILTDVPYENQDQEYFDS